MRRDFKGKEILVEVDRGVYTEGYFMHIQATGDLSTVVVYEDKETGRVKVAHCNRVIFKREDS